MEKAPMTYRIISAVECLTQPINGNKSGQWMRVGDTFESATTAQGGWVKVADKRWIPLSACVLITAPPIEPDEPPVTGEGRVEVNIVVVDDNVQSVVVNGDAWVPG